MTTKTPRAPKPKKPANKDAVQSGKAAKREQFVQANAGMRLLGEIITWSAGKDSHVHSSVVTALKDAGLDETVARELLPRQAFGRACKKLTEERVIDVVNEDGRELKFQFTKRYVDEVGGEKGWKYERECYLTLDKELGKVACPGNPTLEAAAQVELDRCMEARTSSDITKIVQKLFDKEADLFPVRDQGGVYFVPQTYAAFVEKVDAFLSKLGGRTNRFPVPADTQQGDRSVQEAILNGLSLVIEDHREAVQEFGLDTRHDTIQRQAEKIKATRVKVEAYAQYLNDKKDEMLQAVEDANLALQERVKQLTEERAKAPAVSSTAGGNRAFIFSYSVTAVIRWMGRQGWGYKDARKVIDSFCGVGTIAEATVRAQLLGGRKSDEERGPPAPLTEEQIKDVEARRAAPEVKKEAE